LLNLAAGLVEPGESYLDVGAVNGLSIIAAMRGNPDATVVAVASILE